MAWPLLVIVALHAVPSHAQGNTANKRVGILSGFGCEGSIVDLVDGSPNSGGWKART
jgi:hypothetical protein